VRISLLPKRFLQKIHRLLDTHRGTTREACAIFKRAMQNTSWVLWFFTGVSLVWLTLYYTLWVDMPVLFNGADRIGRLAEAILASWLCSFTFLVLSIEIPRARMQLLTEDLVCRSELKYLVNDFALVLNSIIIKELRLCDCDTFLEKVATRAWNSKRALMQTDTFGGPTGFTFPAGLVWFRDRSFPRITHMRAMSQSFTGRQVEALILLESLQIWEYMKSKNDFNGYSQPEVGLFMAKLLLSLRSSLTLLMKEFNYPEGW
jgi:hypothetical protein